MDTPYFLCKGKSEDVERHFGGRVAFGMVICKVLTWLRLEDKGMTLDQLHIWGLKSPEILWDGEEACCLLYWLLRHTMCEL